VATSWSSAGVSGGVPGGLVSANYGTVSGSFSSGNVTARGNATGGGLVGANYDGSIENSYATGPVTGVRLARVGGFVGDDETWFIEKSYSTGAVGGRGASVGGFVCTVEQGAFAKTYWDTKTSGTDMASCAGDQAGITGLTSKQLRSGLPKGFSPKIWAEDANINNGFPYLIANPPPK
jgi:hypothetical protein